MNVGDVVKRLVTADEYLGERMKVSDDFIDMMRCCLPSDYAYIAEKEEAYQEVLQTLSKATTNDS